VVVVVMMMIVKMKKIKKIYTDAISTFLHTMQSSFSKHERDGGGGLLHGSE